MIQRFFQTFQNMRAVFGFLQIKFRAAHHHDFSVINILFQNIFKIQNGRLNAVHQRQHIYAEILLKIGKSVEFIQNFLRKSVFFKFHHHAHTILIRFITQILDTGNFSVAHQFGNMLNQSRFVGSISHFRDDNLESAGFCFHNFRLGSLQNLSASGLISG